MLRNLKTLGLTAFALLVLGVMVAPAVQAEVTLTTGLTTTPGPNDHTAATIHAVQTNPGAEDNELTTNSLTSSIGSIHCENSATTLSATTTGTNKTLTVTPSYNDCSTIAVADQTGTPSTVTMNGCDYLFNQPATIADGTGRYTGTVNLVCPVSAKVEVEVYAGGTVTAHSIKICTLAMAEVKNLGHVIYKNTAQTPPKRDDVDIEMIITNAIPYTTAGTCGVTAGNMSYKSDITLTSTVHDVWWSD